MNEKEWQNFIQKQRDFEDELAQQEHEDKTAIWRKMLKWAEGQAAKKNMTFEEYTAWVESSPSPKAQGYAFLLKNLPQWSK